MNELKVQVAQNGFVVHEGEPHGHNMGKIWAFESPASLADFVKEWGEEKDRSNIGKVKAEKI